MEINSPFRYPGGKFYARKLILELLPGHDYYIEPFAGGASIFFAKNKSRKNWLNDIDKDLINCLKIMKDRPEDLIESLKGELAVKERHKYFKTEYLPKNDLERAKRWFYLNRTSYSGIMKAQNCFWGYGDKYSMRPENWPRNIRRTSEKLQGVRLTSYDFGNVIKNTPDGAFLFIDPPYFNADQDKFYTHSFKKDDHLKLAKLLKEHSGRINFLLTYDNSPEIRDLYDWSVHILEKEWNYTINRTDDQKKNSVKSSVKGARNKGREIFIINYDIKLKSQETLFSDLRVSNC
jgi:DNA adenine methylase